MSNILVVDDEKVLGESIKDALASEGYQVIIASNGQIGFDLISTEPFDLIILDVMMPEINGIDLCKKVRQMNVLTPILFLTVNNDPEDRILGLEAGGDDYLGKPFHLKELLLRTRKLLQRTQWYARTNDSFAFADIYIDFSSYQIESWDKRLYSLTQKEAMILKLLIENEGATVSREDILEKIWGYESYPSTRTIDNFIVRLRKRIERNPEQPTHLHTIRGVGYKFTKHPLENNDPAL
jgi:two-component system alkaline phosphatase synthesis response regulator PhoP